MVLPVIPLIEGAVNLVYFMDQKTITPVSTSLAMMQSEDLSEIQSVSEIPTSEG
jgi:hypothetical protein